MPSTQESFSLYVHIPYCIKKCPYCDFNVHVAPVLPEREYTAALIAELESYCRSSDWQRRSLQSIFFGGGTPSMFAPDNIGRVIERASRLFPFEKEIEISLEANPDRDDCARLPRFRSCGVNRISIGAQSFQLRLLKYLGRLHTADETRRALHTACGAGYESISLDLIYAVPSQSLTELEADLLEALSFAPHHLSAYNLTFEEGTPVGRDYRAGKIQSLPEDTEIAMAKLIEDMAAAHGLERYEISNYAKPGFQSCHNKNYWLGGDYLGIGAGAHSYKRVGNGGMVWGRRWRNEKSPRRYMNQVREMAKAVSSSEEIDKARAAGEFMFLGLRMMQGISPQEFSRRFGQPPDDLYSVISDLLNDGLMEKAGSRLRLTSNGLLVANSIFVHFV
ncbi:MAG: radical SAM family heme chaperone HemW [Candidatus Binatia bacterium]